MKISFYWKKKNIKFKPILIYSSKYKRAVSYLIAKIEKAAKYLPTYKTYHTDLTARKEKNRI